MPGDCDALVTVSLQSCCGGVPLCGQLCTVYLWLGCSIRWAEFSLCAVILNPGLAAFLPDVML